MSAAAEAPLNSTIFDWTQMTAVPTRAGECRNFFDTATRTLARLESHVSTVRPGEASHAPHTHPEEEIVIVKEGTLEVSINGVVSQAGAGSMFFFASRDLHGLRNPGSVPVSYHVIRIFPRDLPAS